MEISVAPRVVAAAVAVKGDPIQACARAHADRDQRTPTAKTTVGQVEFGIDHAVLGVDAVVGNGFEIVAAQKIQFTVKLYERATGFCTLQALSHVAIA